MYRGFASALFFLLALVVGCTHRRIDPKNAVTLNVSLATERYVLANGLAVILHPDRSAASAYVHVRYHVGAKDDPPSKSGLAHLFEHLMFRSVPVAGEEDFTSRLDAVGAAYNATTSLDTTDYFTLLPSSHLPLALWLEAKRMRDPVGSIDDAAFGAELAVVQNEWRERYENRDYGNVIAEIRRLVYGASHPYGRPTIGAPRELGALTPADARAFARYYVPSNATLVVVGSFDPAVAKEHVRRTFGLVEHRPLDRRPRTFPAPRIADARVEMRANVSSRLLALAWTIPPPHADGATELAYAVDLLEQRLRYRLVVDEELADHVDFSTEERELGSFAVLSVRSRPGIDQREVEEAVDDVLRRAGRGERLEWGPFGDVRTMAMVSEITRLEHLSGRARRLLHDERWHAGKDATQEDLRRLQAVTPGDVGAAIRHFLVDAPRLAVVVTPDPSAPRAGVVAEVQR